MTVLRWRGQDEITRVGDRAVQLTDRAGLMINAQALRQLNQALAGDDRVSGEEQ